VKEMSKSQATRRNEGGQVKRQEIIDLLASMRKTQLNDAREISSLSLNEPQELLKYGIKK